MISKSYHNSPNKKMGNFPHAQMGDSPHTVIVPLVFPWKE